MLRGRKMKIDWKIAYFIGVLHSDAHIYKFNNKKEGSVRNRLLLQIGPKSLPMANKFKQILYTKFGRDVNIRKLPNKEAYKIQASINLIYPLLKNWQKYNLPLEIKEDSLLFGAYLAGLIDGDGYVKYKKYKGQIFACQIKIAAKEPLEEIASLIELHLNCKVHYEKDKNKRGTGYNTCFLISSKNYRYLLENLEPHLTIPYKKERITTVCHKWL